MTTNEPKNLFSHPLLEKAVPLIIILCGIFVYGQVLRFDFVEYDDDRYILNNPEIQQPIGMKAVKWAFTATYQSTWQPLVWLSYLLDYQILGLHPGVFHFTNLFFHLLNTLLLYFLLKTATKQVWTSAMVAFCFACHPLHVESVAWIAERKDVLSTFFFLAAVYNHLLYSRRPGIIRYLFTLVLFALGLMAKPMIVTLPFVLLLVDYWPLNRVRPDEKGKAFRRALWLLAEKIPLFLLTIVFSIATYRIQESSGAVSSLAVIGFQDRLANALTSYGWYLLKTVWPVDLSVIYLHTGTVPLAPALFSGLVLAGIAIWVFRGYRDHPWRLVGFLWYLGTLVPVIGLVQFGKHSHADRFAYIPLMGIYLLVCWEFFHCFQKRNPLIIAPFIALLMVPLMIQSHRQAAYWESGVTLFGRVLELDPQNTTAMKNMGAALIRKGQIREGIVYIEKVIEITPASRDLHLGLGRTYRFLGDLEKALDHYEQGKRQDPGNLEAKTRIAEIAFRLAAQSAQDSAPEKAMLWLEKAVANGFSDWGKIDEGSEFQTIRNTPPFRDRLAELR